MSQQPQIESTSMLTALYCVQAEIHQLFQGTQFWSNFEFTKCCGYLEYKVKVIKISVSKQCIYRCKFGGENLTGS